MTDPTPSLVSGQYQIDDIIFGKHTTVRVEEFKINSYEQNVQDYQVAKSDTVRFGWDNLKPTTVEITFHIMKNYDLEPYGNPAIETWGALDKLEAFVTAWKADDVRKEWGTMKALIYCRTDGELRMLLGRPGKFTYEKDQDGRMFISCMGEFRRHDTNSYSDESNVDLLPDKTALITRTAGNSPSWVRISGVGPVKNPDVKIGDEILQIPIEAKKGEKFEVSSYPWQRHLLHHDGTQVRKLKIVPDGGRHDKFFNRLIIPHNQEVPVDVRAGSILKNGQIKIHWRDVWNAV